MSILEKDPEYNRGKYVSWEVITAIVVGSLILYLFVPRLVASILLIPGNHKHELLQSKKNISDKDYNLLITSRKDAIGWVHSGKTWGELGIAQSWYAHKIGFNTTAGKAALTNSITSLRRSLTLAPGNTFAWSGLAYSYLARTGYSVQDITECLKISIMTAPYQPKLVFERLKLSLSLYGMFDSDGRDLIKSQIVVAAKLNSGKLAKMISSENYTGPKIENVLGTGSPEYSRYLKYKNNHAGKSGK